MDKKYIVKPEEKMVIAIADTEYGHYCGIGEEVITYCSNQTYAMLLKLIDFHYDNKKLPNLDIELDTDFKSVAKCDKYDEFNEKTGREIAGGKAEMKYHRAMARKYIMILDVLDKAAAEIDELYNKHKIKANNIENSIKRYIQHKNN